MVAHWHTHLVLKVSSLGFLDAQNPGGLPTSTRTRVVGTHLGLGASHDGVSQYSG